MKTNMSNKDPDTGIGTKSVEIAREFRHLGTVLANSGDNICHEIKRRRIIAVIFPIARHKYKAWLISMTRID